MSEKLSKLEDTKIRCFRRTDVAPGALLSFVPGDDATALVYTPQQCVFARVADGALIHPDIGSIDPEEAFEIRIFDKDWELRWRREGEKGTAILWSEEAGGFGGVKAGKQPVKERGTRYLLWGKVIAPPQNGWVTLGTHQVGTLQAPYSGAIKKDDHLALKAMEYFAEFDDGNMAFIGERLTGIMALGSGGGAK